jgi:hypothetical protein
MNGAFVLLLYVSSVSGQAAGALTTARFETLALCQTAGEKAVAAFGGADRRVNFVCAEVGSKVDTRH